MIGRRRFAILAAVAMGSLVFAGCAAPADGTDAPIEARADELTVAEANEATRTLIVKFRKYSALWDNGAHVCNDDTLLQRDAIYYDTSYDRSVGPVGYYQSGMGSCSDNTKLLQAPGCH